MTKFFTLCLLHQHPRILLGMKKRGFGAGRWNGFGGKVQEGETIEQAATREFTEEAGIEVQNMSRRGVLEFRFHDKPDDVLEVHIFHSAEFLGEPVEGEEMKPEWWPVDQIPFQDMWPDDVHWFPLFLAGKTFKGTFLFGPGDAVLEYSLEESLV